MTVFEEKYREIVESTEWVFLGTKVGYVLLSLQKFSWFVGVLIQQ